MPALGIQKSASLNLIQDAMVVQKWSVAPKMGPMGIAKDILMKKL